MSARCSTERNTEKSCGGRRLDAIAEILPFRLSRRQDLTRSVARRMTDLYPDSAERHLQRQLLIQRQALERKGVDPDIITREISGLEAAIRGELWHLVLSPLSPGSAA